MSSTVWNRTHYVVRPLLDVVSRSLCLEPDNVNKNEGHGSCGTVGEKGGARGCIAGGGGSGKGAVRKGGSRVMKRGGGGRQIPDTNSTHAPGAWEE